MSPAAGEPGEPGEPATPVAGSHGLRIRFAKEGKVRFVGHRDLARIWERVLRRTTTPVAYSQGFTPRPRVAFGLALSTGSASRAEYIDVVLDPERPSDRTLEELPEVYSAALPVGVDVNGVAIVNAGATSLQHVVTSCRWELQLNNITIDELADRTAAVLAAPSIVVTRERKGKPVTDDLRPAILALEVDGAASGPRPVLCAEIGTQPRTVRLAELSSAFEPPLEIALARRTHQWIERDGARLDPLAVDTTAVVDLLAGAAPVPRTGACA